MTLAEATVILWLAGTVALILATLSIQTSNFQVTVKLTYLIIAAIPTSVITMYL